MIGTINDETMKVTSCSRMLGWSVCGNRHRCNEQPVFIAIKGDQARSLCEDCAEKARQQGWTLLRIV